MTMLSFICIFIFFVLLLSMFIKRTDVFSPMRLFVMIWSFSIGLAELKLSRFQFEWNSYSWLILLLSLFSFFLGMFIVFVINVNKKMVSVEKNRNFLKSDSFDAIKLSKITIMLFILYLLAYFVTYEVMGYVPLFTRYPDALRSKWGIFGAGLFVQIAPVLIYFSSLAVYVFKNDKLNRIKMLCVLMGTIITYFFLMQRFFLLFGLILFGVFIYYYTNKFNKKNILFFILVIALLLYAISEIRTSHYALNFLFYLSRMKINVRYAVLTEPYMYIVMNLENFANAVNKLNNYSYGYFTFDFLWAFSGLKHTLAEYISFSEFPYLITNNFNTYTMFFVYYRDFGVFGAGFIPLILGAFISYLYYKMRLKTNIFTISVYGTFFIVLIFSFIIPLVSWLIFSVNLTIIYFASRAVVSNPTFKEK